VKYSTEALARLNDNPLYRTLGIRLDWCEDGQAQATMNPSPEVCWPSDGQPHGGILFTLIDTSMAFAALSTAQADSACATVDCSIQYAAPARQAPFVSQVTTMKRGGRTVFVRAQIVDGAGEIIALGQGTFRLFEKP